MLIQVTFFFLNLLLNTNRANHGTHKMLFFCLFEYDLASLIAIALASPPDLANLTWPAHE